MQPEKSKRVAIPVTNQQLSEFFGTCSHYEIFEIGKKELTRFELQLPDGIQLTDLPEWLEKKGVTDVIAYKVNKQIISLFATRKVNLFVGIRQEEPQSLIDKYLQGRLESDKKIINEITEN